MHSLQAVQTDTGCNVWLDNDAKKFRNDSLSQPVLTIYTPRVSRVAMVRYAGQPCYYHNWPANVGERFAGRACEPYNP